MNNFELISYKQYPEDPYTKAIARVRIDRKHVVVYAKKEAKNGGAFWCAPSVSVTENGEKKYLSAHKLDSEVENEMLIEFIEEAVKQGAGGKIQQQGSVFPHGLPTNSAPDYSSMPPPRSMDEVANQQALPF